VSNARLTVVVGGGGVGKTTSSAALCLSAARAGKKSLVVTVDPARRLADALGVRVGIESCAVTVDGVELFARMPDARRSVDVFADWLFEDPAARQRVKDNGMYRELGNALAGVHELICVAFVDHELGSGRYEEIVLDTAPSRHALEFLDYPARLGRMLEARTLEWVAALGRIAGATLDDRPDGRGLFAWGRKRVAELVGSVVGVHAIRDIANLFAEFVLVRERWLELAERVARRLRSSGTRYVVVTGSGGASLDDAEFLLTELGNRQLRPTAVVLNRAVDKPPAWLTEIVQRSETDATLAAAVRAYVSEYDARAAQTSRARHRLERILPSGVPVAVLPSIRSNEPLEILRTLADGLCPIIGTSGD
jgi:anion-transporting  ArsA/GET3 family ATPase